jgi:hypothetical protein
VTEASTSGDVISTYDKWERSLIILDPFNMGRTRPGFNYRGVVTIREAVFGYAEDQRK